jgi:hypothetical protein
MQNAPAHILIALALISASCSGARAQDRPDYWAVTGVASDDVLNLRDVPSADSKSLARIPPRAHGLKNLGCRRNQLPLELWMRMNEKARRESRTLWCRVEYLGKQGWVAGRYLRKDAAPGH